MSKISQETFPTRTAAYVRMSTEHQQYSTSNQMDVIREYAKRRGLEIVKEYSDEGKSGLSIQGRDSLSRMIKDVQDEVADFSSILVYDVSRWGRFQDADESAYYEYISKADTPETQRELLKAYEAKQLNFQSIRTVKRLMDQRRFFGKNRKSVGYTPRKSRTTAESMVNAFKRESQRQKLLIRKAKICDARLVFVVTAFDRLLGDDNLVTLLRAETLATMPKYLWSKLSPKHKGTT